MPKVIIQAHAATLSTELITRLCKQIPYIIAKALTVQDTEAEVHADEVEIEVKEFGPWDVGKKSFEFEVQANDYPERSKNLAERRMAIQKGIRSTLPGRFNMSVWLRVQQGSYGEA